MTNETMTPEMNTVYENIKGSIPDRLDSITKKFGTMVLAGEVYRCNTDRSKLSAENNKFSLSLKLDKPTFAALKKFNAEGGRKLTGLKDVHVKVKELDENGEPIKVNDKFVFKEDDMGDPVKEFSHYQISVYQNPTVKGKEVDIQVVDAATGTPVTGIIAEGSKVAVSVSAYDTTFRDKPARGLNLGEIKVFEHVELGGGGSVDPWAAFGLSKTDVAAMAPPPPSAPSESAEQSFEEGENDDKGSTPPSSDLPDDEWDDDIPF